MGESAQNNKRVGDFQGFPIPQYTGTPKVIVDSILSQFDITPSELNVLLYLVRRIYGWSEHRQNLSDNVALSQFLNGIVKSDGTRLDHGAGLTKKSLLTALRLLQDKGLIHRIKRKHKSGADAPTQYTLVLNHSLPTSNDRPFPGLAMFLVPNAFFDQYLGKLTFREKRVFLFLCRWASLEDDGRISLSKKRMLDGVVKKDGSIVSTGLDRRNLIRVVKSLVDKGLIKAQQRKANHGGYLANIYSLNTDHLDMCMPGAQVVAKNTPLPLVATDTPPPIAKNAPPLVAKTTPPVIAKITPHKNLPTKPISTKPSRHTSEELKLVKYFYQTLGRRVTSQKLQKGLPTITELLISGFSPQDIIAGADYLAATYPDTRWIDRLPFLLDEALRHRDIATLRNERKQQIAAINAPATDALESDHARRAFDDLPPQEQRRRIASVRSKLIASDYGRRSIAIAQFAQEQPTGEKTPINQLVT